MEEDAGKNRNQLKGCFNMIKRRKTKIVTIGSVKIGSLYPVAIQSMTKVATTDIERCTEQIKQLAEAGCSLVRVAIPRRIDSQAFAKIVQQVKVPLIADIHFSAERAIEAIEAGAAKIRLNPGNIKKSTDIERIIDAAKMHKTAIRIGINEASIRDLKKEDIPASKRINLMLAELKRYVRIFEQKRFDQLVLSVKSSDCLRTIETNRQMAAEFDYPIHLGLTHAGLPEDAAVPSAVALGTLLAEGIGDTVRVSAAGNPLEEVNIAKQILSALGLYKQQKPELIVCPTCGRAEIDIVSLARAVKEAIISVKKPLRIAVMGCIVNGPGEAADADLAICGGKDKALIYRKGKKIATCRQKDITALLTKELKRL
jgi:(E)-4-hydroxy-3-methylbut-2-enyl-diphosphate synthase